MSSDEYYESREGRAQMLAEEIREGFYLTAAERVIALEEKVAALAAFADAQVKINHSLTMILLERFR